MCWRPVRTSSGLACSLWKRRYLFDAGNQEPFELREGPEWRQVYSTERLWTDLALRLQSPMRKGSREGTEQLERRIGMWPFPSSSKRVKRLVEGLLAESVESQVSFIICCHIVDHTRHDAHECHLSHRHPSFIETFRLLEIKLSISLRACCHAQCLHEFLGQISHLRT